jgi:hypothetical protein
MPSPTQAPRDDSPDDFESLNLRELWNRVARGAAQIIGFGLLGVVGACLFYFASSLTTTVTTSAHVVFSFPGFERGQYPDGSRFHPDDLRSSGVVSEALSRGGFDHSSDFQSKIQSGLSMEALIPPEINKIRDRLRAEGQVLAPIVADEYRLTLTLPRTFKFNGHEREVLLTNIINVYQENFERTYSDVPAPFANVFDTLRDSDFTDYELILTKDLQSITKYLTLQVNRAPAFRSITTRLSFGDLLEETELFTEVNLDGILSKIYFQGISKNRQAALLKINYYLHTLEEQENKAIQEERVLLDLLAKSQDRAQNYVLGVKTSTASAHPEGPILDQGLIDSLLANDAYNFLIRKDLDAGMKVKDLQAEHSQLLERRKQLESISSDPAADANQAASWADVEKSLSEIERQYSVLLTKIQKTNADFGRQEFASAIRISGSVAAEEPTKGPLFVCAVGLVIGVFAGLGLSFVGVYIGSSPRSG